VIAVNPTQSQTTAAFKDNAHKAPATYISHLLLAFSPVALTLLVLSQDHLRYIVGDFIGSTFYPLNRTLLPDSFE
jgi:hypothetical protein